MKKILSVLLAAVLALSLAACGGSAASSTAASGAGEEAATLRVAMECAYAPYNWTQNDDSNGAVSIAGSSDFANGYDVMWAKALGEQLGRPVEIVKLDWDSLIPALQSGDVDAVIAGQSITADRLEQVDFSAPYYYASIVTLVKADGAYADAAGIADLAGATCTSQLGTVWYDVCLPQIADADIQPSQETAPAMLVALESGATDLVCTDMPTAMAACVAYPDLKILDFSGSEDNYQVSDEEINIGISVKKENAEILDACNAMLSGKTAADFDKMMADAIAIQPLSE